MTAIYREEQETNKHHSPAAAVRNGEVASEVPLSAYGDDLIERV